MLPIISAAQALPKLNDALVEVKIPFTTDINYVLARIGLNPIIIDLCNNNKKL
jgi:hypothetical protein